MEKKFIAYGALLAMISVLLGAFGAHGLKTIFSDQQMQWYQTAVQYQIYHAFGLIVSGICVAVFGSSKALRVSGILFIIGIIFFCGSLYAMSFTQIRMLGAITPLGGLAFIIAWLCLFIASINFKFEKYP